MRHLLAVLLATLAWPGEADAPRRIVRTTAELRSLTDDEFQSELPVEICGTALATRYYGGVIVQDAAGGFFFEDIPEPRPQNGDLVRVTGRTHLYGGIRQGAVRGCRATILQRGRTVEPIRTSAAEIASGSANFRLVKVRGLVIEAMPDENDPLWNYLVLQDNGTPLYASVPNKGSGERTLGDLVNAEIEIVGTGVPHYGAERMFIGPHLETWSKDCIHVIRKAPGDPFDAPRLGDIVHVSPLELAKMQRRRVEGRVLACWQSNKLLLEEDSGRVLNVDLVKGQTLPRVGNHAVAVGFPGTDLFRIKLLRALCKTRHDERETVTKTSLPPAVSATKIMHEDHGKRLLNQAFHGKAVRLRGVIRSLPTSENSDGRMNLDCDGILVSVDLSANPSAAAGLVLGCEIEVRGICVMETESWSPTNLFPVFGGFMLVPQSPNDIRILSRPSWWTPGRLLVVICSLFAALLGIAVWNRVLNRLVEKRGRQLFKEQIARAGESLKVGERTRLAVELHDSLSQNLAGLACQITAARSSVPPDAAAALHHLDTAERMLLSCRTELRRCLWDLRGDTLEMDNMADAVRKTVEPVIGDAELTVRFNVPRARLLDSTAHSILCIVRELAANAIRHGHAAHIRIAGEFHDERLSFSVRDDGFGFDTENYAGLADGHFGLEGIRERVERLDGTFEITSSPECGTRAAIALAIPHGDQPSKQPS